jgi:hypothetical protein
MRTLLTLASCAVVLVTALAQEKTAPKPPASSATEKQLEGKIRQAWQDYKNRNKPAFAAILANDFGEVTNDADGIADKNAELSEMDHFSLARYELSGFKFRPVGNSGALMTYTAQYSGTYDNAPLEMKAIYGEVWIKDGNDWKLVWVQETKLK